MRTLINYLAGLSTGKTILWCYLIWYAVMIGFYFDPRLSLWVGSLGISIVIGIGLVLSVMPAGGIRAMEKWAVARLFITPFCVSSFAALIKDQNFIIIFSPGFTQNAAAVVACAVFVVVTLVCKAVLKQR